MNKVQIIKKNGWTYFIQSSPLKFSADTADIELLMRASVVIDSENKIVKNRHDSEQMVIDLYKLWGYEIE